MIADCSVTRRPKERQAEPSSVSRYQTAEHRRLSASMARAADWKNWGPYLAERAWGTVREDYSKSGDAWNYFPHDHARSRAYRWNEDGLAGFCNRFQNVCLSIALWNGRDPFLKERLFGLANEEGNHGEDVKEYYYYLDGLPSHAYMRMLYKYPQVEYPYALLVEENRRRGRAQGEFELIDAVGDAFAAGRYFDVFVEYAKAAPDDILCRVTACQPGAGAGPSARPAADLVPQYLVVGLFPRAACPLGKRADSGPRPAPAPGRALLVRGRPSQRARLLFTENDTNRARLFGVPNEGPFVKDALPRGDRARERPGGEPGKSGFQGRCALSRAGRARRVAHGPHYDIAGSLLDRPFDDFDAIVAARVGETDEYFQAIEPPELEADLRLVYRQACAGLFWTKQFYHYSVELWLDGDPAGPEPPRERRSGRNSGWKHRVQPRRSVGARQVGISLVRRLGHGVSLHRAGSP